MLSTIQYPSRYRVMHQRNGTRLRKFNFGSIPFVRQQKHRYHSWREKPAKNGVYAVSTRAELNAGDNDQQLRILRGEGFACRHLSVYGC